MISPFGIGARYLKTTFESAVTDSPGKVAKSKQGKDKLCDAAVNLPGFQPQLGVYQVPRLWPGGTATRKVKTKNRN